MDAPTPPRRFVAETIVMQLMSWQACLFGRFNVDEETIRKASEAFIVRSSQSLDQRRDIWPAAASGGKVKRIFRDFLDVYRTLLENKHLSVWAHLQAHFKHQRWKFAAMAWKHFLRDSGTDTGFQLRTANFRILHFSSLICPPSSSFSSTKRDNLPGGIRTNKGLNKKTLLYFPSSPLSLYRYTSLSILCNSWEVFPCFCSFNPLALCLL